MKEISKIVPKSSHILVWRLETPTVVACLKIETVCNPSQVLQRFIAEGELLYEGGR